MTMIFDKKRYAAKARQVMAEGCVLLENHEKALPLAAGSRIALFGRSQFHYYKSGTGSGGMVNAEYVTGIREAILESKTYVLDEEVDQIYQEWLVDHPYDEGQGWASEPWFQQEMPLDHIDLKAVSGRCDAAIILIGRTAGEDQDNQAKPGSYYLTEDERSMLAEVCNAFPRSIVLLNVGNIIDMSWVKACHPSAVMYIWQGGQEGGNGALDLLCGKESPSGKLPDTIAASMDAYPAAGNFGDPKENVYAEDIYVGYRYFETFARQEVCYPFGFGLSYTTFSINADAQGAASDGNGMACKNGKISDPEKEINITVTNTGDTAGKEVVQMYVRAPQGKLGKADVSLIAYAKTDLLQPGESQDLCLVADPYRMASYDDDGSSGYINSYVLEAGSYEILIGNSCRNLQTAFTFQLEKTIQIQQLEEILNPPQSFNRLCPKSECTTEDASSIRNAQNMENESNPYEKNWKKSPAKTLDYSKRRIERLPAEIPYSGDLGYKLRDVAEGRISMETFIAQLSDEDLCCLTRGEGMNSPKVTPGTGGSYGGMTQRLVDFGIPTCCCSDGPSGIRMDCGTIAFSMPNGTAMASTFNDALIEEMYEWEGLELRRNQIELLLGPGMNLHRHPLNGRNFEYFSEDPLLSGKMAAAQLRGMHKYGVSGTIKHFAGNNQEFHRHQSNGLVSQRAMRELYLKGFEIAVKEGHPGAVMSTYGAINGRWTAASYDLQTIALRDEWGFDGFVMTDWWANLNDPDLPGQEMPSKNNTAAMVRAQNDVYMVVANAEENSNEDNLMASLADGTLTRGELQRSAMNVCRATINTQAYRRLTGQENELDKQLQQERKEEPSDLSDVTLLDIIDQIEIPEDKVIMEKGKTSVFQVWGHHPAIYELRFEAKTTSTNPLAQLPMTIIQDNMVVRTLTFTGENNDWENYTIKLNPSGLNNFFLKLYFGSNGIQLRNITLVMAHDITIALAKLRKAMADGVHVTLNELLGTE